MTDSTGQTPRARRREARRAGILAAAMRLLEEGGIAAVTVHAIAAEVDLTVGALYRYFPGKDAILGALLEEVLAVFEAELQRAAEGASTPLEGLIACTLAYVDLADREPARYRLITAMLVEPRQILQGDARQQAMDRAFSLLGALLVLFEGAAAAGELQRGAAQLRVVQLWSALSGILLLRKIAAIDPGEIPYTGLVEATARDLFTAWGADPEALERMIGEAGGLRRRST